MDRSNSLNTDNDNSDSTYRDETSEDEQVSQQPRPQQFYQDLDNSLDNLPKSSYIQKLVELCKADPKRIGDYRERLADRVKATENFQQCKLVNRRNSTSSLKSRKYAQDCYVLHMFLNGSRSKEIHDLFSQCQNAADCDQTLNMTYCHTTDNEESHESKDPTYTARAVNVDVPEMITMLLNLQSDMAFVKNSTEQNSNLLRSLSNDFQQVTVNVRTMLASVNGLRSRATDGETINKIQSDMTQLNANFATMNKRINDSILNTQCGVISKTAVTFADIVQQTCEAPQSILETNNERIKSKPKRTEPVANTIERDKVEIIVEKTCDTADVFSKQDRPEMNSMVIEGEIRSPCKYSKSMPSYKDKRNNKVYNTDKARKETKVNEHYERNSQQITSTQTSQTREQHEASSERFTAVRRKNTNSYYLGNIDPDSTDSDIYQYITDRKVKCTYITMYYGKNGSAAKVNIPVDFADQVECDRFWPNDITFRKWKRKSYWENQSRNTHTKHSRRPYNHGRDDQRRRSYDNYNNNNNTYESDDNQTRNDVNDSNSAWGNQYDDWNDNIDSWATSNPEAY